MSRRSAGMAGARSDPTGPRGIHSEAVHGPGLGLSMDAGIGNVAQPGANILIGGGGG